MWKENLLSFLNQFTGMKLFILPCIKIITNFVKLLSESISYLTFKDIIYLEFYVNQIIVKFLKHFYPTTGTTN